MRKSVWKTNIINIKVMNSTNVLGNHIHVDVPSGLFDLFIVLHIIVCNRFSYYLIFKSVLRSPNLSL